MPCGGCAAKLAAPALSRALARLGAPLDDPRCGSASREADDAAAIALPGGELLLATVDAFRAFTDDPFLVGRVAAVNAVSDVGAKGGRPRHALALVTLPEEDPARAEETLVQVLAGVRAALDPLGVSLVGGHTSIGPELFVGLSVTGVLGAGEPLLGKRGLRPGDALILTKPLGTGVVLAADMQGRAPGRALEATLASMLQPNLEAADAARALGARACTDVSGFGLAGPPRASCCARAASRRASTRRRCPRSPALSSSSPPAYAAALTPRTRCFPVPSGSRPAPPPTLPTRSSSTPRPPAASSSAASAPAPAFGWKVGTVWSSEATPPEGNLASQVETVPVLRGAGAADGGAPRVRTCWSSAAARPECAPR